MFYYTAFGFNITSEIEFPELFIREQESDSDVNIRIGITPKYLAEGITANPDLWVTPNQYLIHFKDVAWYYAENGDHVIVEPYQNAEPKSIRLFLLCNAMAAIIHQRKLIPLHASGIVYNDGVVLIVGQSGAGKSTTIKALGNKGHQIFTDDVCVLKLHGNKILVIPSYPMMKLWESSFDLLELGNINDHHKISLAFNKFGLFFHDKFILKWMRVSKIFNIVKSGFENGVSIQKLKGLEAFKIIGENTYRNHYIDHMKLNRLHFEMVAGLLQQSDVFKISRPDGKDSISEVIKFIEQELN